MGDTLEFNEIYQEVKGSWNFTVVCSLAESVRRDVLAAIESVYSPVRRRCTVDVRKHQTSKEHMFINPGAIWTKDFEKISEYFKNNYRVELMEKDLCVKGWNWGTAKFGGPLLSFEVSDSPAFEVPLSNVSQCTTGKNEVTLEFHQNDDAEVSLMEVRFYVPPTAADDGLDPVEAFAQNVLSKADVIQATGDALCIFRELQCLTPRGRYDIRIYPTFLHLHGKTFDYKIPYTTVLRLFLLPHKDQRQMFFVISLDPPIKQGQTRYHFLILLFSKEEDISLTLNMSEEDVEKRFEGKLSKNMSGSLYEMVSRVMKALVNRKITVPGNFQGHSGAQCITCSYKASSGLLYPLERGFIYVHKPPVHLRFDEIACVNFARGTTTTRSFDFEIETKQAAQYTFSSIEREEYGKLFDFVNVKKLNIKNRGFKEGMKGNDNVYSDSDDDQHDAYLERMKEEGKIREEAANDSSDESGEETDESFNPGEEDEDIAEEYDSNASASDSSADDGENDSEAEKERPPKKVKVEKEKKVSKPRKKEVRGQVGAPRGKGGPFLASLKCTSLSQEWEQKAGEAKRNYEKALKEYKESGGGGGGAPASSKKEAKKKGKSEEKKPAKSVGAPAADREKGSESFKSREFISSDESSSDSDHGKGSKAQGSDEEEIASTPPSSEESGSD
uniref:FACT complex subunit SSRP1 n=1 Tax=Lepisosteus oculatus TaxID=7918 RepID=W5MP26_LEPOC